MADFDTTTDGASEVSDEEREANASRSRGTAEYLLSVCQMGADFLLPFR
jgi:hypothetical protein